jgi:methylmalonyl-CoA mutase C-terminal domain/subunit
VDVIGLSILSGAHNFLFPRVAELLKQKDAEDILVLGGGVIPDEDVAILKETCVNEIFTPGTPTSKIVEYIKKNIKK